MAIRYVNPHTFLSAKAATGAGTSLKVSDHRHIVVAVATASSANLTLQAQGSIGAEAGQVTSDGVGTEPTWSGAQSATNHWDYVALSDYDTAVITAGATGFVVAGTDDYKLYEVNVNGLHWLNFNVTARSAGNVTVWAVGYTNQ